ncbi:MAG: PH domain-containing protein [Myxococcota bacterium]
MSYVTRSLSRDEVVIHRARFPLVYHLVSWIWLLTLGILLVGILVFIDREVRAWTSEMVVTSRRIVFKQGLFSVRTEELPLDTVEEVNLHRTFWGQIFGYGQISIAGTGSGTIDFPNAQAPLRFRAAIEEARTHAMRVPAA